ncbi:MAG: cyclic nucleotide-binding domain-containing protein [Gemmatimonadales bacterium]|nr:cyclic nucleotide-binding domain-containing protein [Gemmatimonadales bacterium]
MSWLLSGFLDVRPSERRLALAMFGNYFLVLVSIYLLRPARDSLFLVNLEPAQLPWVYLLTALVAAPVAVLYTRVGRHYRLQRVSILTILCLMAGLLGLYRILEFDQNWVYYLFYAWTGVTGGMVTSQFWLLANAVFDASQAKRLFPLLGVGGIAGAFAGGELTNRLVDNMGLPTSSLVLISLVALGLSGVLGWFVLRGLPLSREARMEEAPEEEQSGRLCYPLLSLLRSRHLLLTIGIISLTVMTSSFVDFQFMSVSWAAYPGESDLTSFLGRFYGRMSLLSLVVQLLLSTHVFRRLGVGGALILLPAFLGLGAVGMFLIPGLAAGIFLRGGEITFKYSLNQTSRELLFLPIPLALKKRTKVFMDVLVHRLARGLAGGMLLLCTGALGMGLRSLALVTLFLLLLWILLVLMMRREYVESFRRALSRREINPEELKVRIDDPTSAQILIANLGSDLRREIIYALKMLRGVKAPGLTESVRPLLDHESGTIRRLALEVLAENGGADDNSAAESLMRDPDLSVRVAALDFLERHGSSRGRPRKFLAEMLAGEPRCRNASLAFISSHADEEDFQHLVNRLVVEEVLNDQDDSGTEGRAILAGLPWVPIGCDEELWSELMADPDQAVVQAAIAGISRRGDVAWTAGLVERLSIGPFQVDSRKALVSLAIQNEAVLEDLKATFFRVDSPVRQRVEITRILAKIPRQGSVDILLRHLTGHQPELRYEALKALGKLRTRSGGLHFPAEVVNREIVIEVGRVFKLARLGELIKEPGDRFTLLGTALREMQQMRMESVFRMLGLRYPAGDLLKAYRGIEGGRRVARANAREFLDNLLVGQHRKQMDLLMDFPEKGIPSDSQLREVGVDPGPSIHGTQDALDYLGASCDTWLAACAVFAGAGVENPDTDRFLQRTGVDMLSTLEKALVLQKVDFFSEIPTDQLGMLAGIAHQVSVLAGDDIFQEGDEPGAFYLVLDGLISQHRQGREVVRAGPLDPIAGLEFFNEEPCFATATAIEDSSILKIDRDEFHELLSDDVRIFKGILRALVGYLREMWESGVEFKSGPRKPFSG